MAYNSTINTAERYFEAINGIIEGMFWRSDDKKVDPGCLSSFLRMRNITVTQVALKAHIWAVEQLQYAIQRFFTYQRIADNSLFTMLEYYRNINLEEYSAYSRFSTLEGALERWTARESQYIRDGDENSAIFCAHKRELTALAMERGVEVKALEQDQDLLAELDSKLGTYNTNALDHVGLLPWRTNW